MQLKSFRKRFTKAQLDWNRNRRINREYRITGRDPIFNKSDVRTILRCFGISSVMVVRLVP